jgi:hypothetical protein
MDKADIQQAGVFRFAEHGYHATRRATSHGTSA